MFGGLTGTDGVDAAKAIGAALAIGLGAIGPASVSVMRFAAPWMPSAATRRPPARSDPR